MKIMTSLLVGILMGGLAHSADFKITSLETNGTVTWANAFTSGVVSVETKALLAAPWQPGQNYFTTNATGSAPVPLTSSNVFCRLLSVDISANSPMQYTNLLHSYGMLETVAGKGTLHSDSSHWQARFEGEWATNVELSRPHIAFGDRWGNVLIVDQRSSSVLKVSPEGRLTTYAGTHIAGDNGDTGWATNLYLNNPNGGWMTADGTLYILDTENGKVRKVDTNGWMTTLFATAEPMGDGRAFWIKSDESLVYFGSGTSASGSGATATILKKWTPAEGVSIVRSDFGELGNITGDERTGDVYISDRGKNRIFRMDTNGVLTTIAGDGTSSGHGGEGFYATNSSLNVPRAVWVLPNGGFFIGEHNPGYRIWYVDAAGILHRWMNGSSANNKRVGDGEWFYANPDLPKVNKVRAITTDPFGNLIITESNYGYVRRIRFQRLTP